MFCHISSHDHDLLMVEERNAVQKQIKINEETHKTRTKIRKLKDGPGVYSPVDHICWQLAEELRLPNRVTAFILFSLSKKL